eukprot:2585593-Pyramimonas_sp.AAC.1
MLKGEHVPSIQHPKDDEPSIICLTYTAAVLSRQAPPKAIVLSASERLRTVVPSPRRQPLTGTSERESTPRAEA